MNRYRVTWIIQGKKMRIMWRGWIDDIRGARDARKAMKGVPMRERWRLARVSMSGAKIANSKDAVRVKPVVLDARRALRRTWLLRPPVLIGGLVLILFGVPYTVLFSAHNASNITFGVIAPVLAAAGVVYIRWILIRQARTAEVNGWAT